MFRRCNKEFSYTHFLHVIISSYLKTNIIFIRRTFSAAYASKKGPTPFRLLEYGFYFHLQILLDRE